MLRPDMPRLEGYGGDTGDNGNAPMIECIDRPISRLGAKIPMGGIGNGDIGRVIAIQRHGDIRIVGPGDYNLPGARVHIYQDDIGDKAGWFR